MLDIRPAGECRWDIVALGEVMLRLDPGEHRIHTTRTFSVYEGGSEYNVARALRRCFGLRSGVVTALADNPVGRLVEDLMLQGGVEPVSLTWMPYDGVGREVRNGLNFVERGFGVRGAVGCSDRGHTAVSQLEPGTVDWDAIFGEHGVRWLHCGGVFAALSDRSAAVAAEAMAAARRYGTIVSYDLNYRPSLWRARGGAERALEVDRELARDADVLLGVLGIEVDAELAAGDPARFDALLERVLDELPGLSVVATTLRRVHTATRNDWTAVCRTRDGFHTGAEIDDLQILDRVGGGDSFAAGFFYGLLTGRPTDEALSYGIAHGALAMTTPGDTSMATLPEVELLMAGADARVMR